MCRRRVAMFTACAVLVVGVAAGLGWVVWARDRDIDKGAALLPADTLLVTGPAGPDQTRLGEEVSGGDVGGR